MQSYIEMLQLAGARFAIYDMGRSCVELSVQTFEDAVSRRAVYPAPFMGKAMLMVVSHLRGSTTEVAAFNFDAINLPLDRKGYVAAGAMEAYTTVFLAERMSGMADLARGRTSASGLVQQNQFSWMPTWGEAFMAQAHFARKVGGKTEPARVRTAKEGLLSGRLGSKVGDDFSWSDDFGVQELGLAELIVRAVDDGTLAEALAQGVRTASLPVLTSLCEFMTHAQLTRSVIAALEERTRGLMVSVKAGDAIYGQLLQALGGCKDHSAMAPLMNAILDQKVGGSAEILTRMVRYHRVFMGEHKAFEIDKVLEPASRNPSGIDVFFAYVLDMIRVKSLHRRIMLEDFGVLSPGVKARLRETMQP